jgi:hypothetical protein
MPRPMTSLFVAWQNPIERSWFTVGRLSSEYGRFRFDYTQGAMKAEEEGFRPFSAFPDLLVSYESERLFPFFGNRLLSRTRREYEDFVRWVSHHEESDDPILLLAQSGGVRMTDSLELFPRPELDERGHYHIHFFAHGLSHMPASAAKRAEELKHGDRLLIMKDIQNPVDKSALMLRTDGSYDQDVYFLGYFPRYLAADISKIVDGCRFAPVYVLRVNPPPAPIQYRVMCCFEIHPPRGVSLFDGPEFLPINSLHSLPRSVRPRELGKGTKPAS